MKTKKKVLRAIKVVHIAIPLRGVREAACKGVVKTSHTYKPPKGHEPKKSNTVDANTVMSEESPFRLGARVCEACRVMIHKLTVNSIVFDFYRDLLHAIDKTKSIGTDRLFPTHPLNTEVVISPDPLNDDDRSSSRRYWIKGAFYVAPNRKDGHVPGWYYDLMVAGYHGSTIILHEGLVRGAPSTHVEEVKPKSVAEQLEEINSKVSDLQEQFAIILKQKITLPEIKHEAPTPPPAPSAPTNQVDEPPPPDRRVPRHSLLRLGSSNAGLSPGGLLSKEAKDWSEKKDGE